MGKTNLIILIIGISACFVLSLLMQHVVKVKKNQDVHPVAKEINNIFGRRLDGKPTFELKQLTKGAKEKGTLAVLTISPKLPVAANSLVRSTGEYVWGMRGGKLLFDRLEIVTRFTTGQKERRFKIPRPMTTWRRNDGRKARSRKR